TIRQLQQDLEDNRARMTALERQAADLAAEDLQLRRELIQASQAVQQREADLTALEARLVQLDQREAALRGRMGADAEAQSAMLSALVRIARRPTLSWVDPRQDATDGVRSAIVMREALPAIAERAEALRADLADLAALRVETEDQRRAAAAATRSLATERAAVAALIEQRASKTARTEAERAETAQRLQAIAREEKSIRALAARLERERLETEERLRRQQAALSVTPAPPPRARGQAVSQDQLRRFPRASPGALSAPVTGALAQLFGATDDVGEKTEGLEIRTRANAQVVAPYDGEVVFADNFGGYGRMLMIRHRGDYISTLAGLGRLDVAVGDLVLEGEPVGVMSNEAAPSLYLELRRKARPIDPQPWLARRNGDGIG
ncbi:MAG: peptidoglycan DD-metalloendopeptidase family protein, partial [Pseudomonadota bacterium]